MIDDHPCHFYMEVPLLRDCRKLVHLYLHAQGLLFQASLLSRNTTLPRCYAPQSVALRDRREGQNWSRLLYKEVINFLQSHTSLEKQYPLSITATETGISSNRVSHWPELGLLISYDSTRSIFSLSLLSLSVVKINDFNSLGKSFWKAEIL